MSQDFKPSSDSESQSDSLPEEQAGTGNNDLPEADADTDANEVNPEVFTHIGELLQPVVERVVTQMVSTRFSGPLPPPAILREYNELIPNGAERIMIQAESEQNHRHAFELQALAIFGRGQKFGLTIGILALAAAVFLGYIGQTLPSSIIGGASLLGLVTVFVTGRKSKIKPENDEE